MRKTSNTFILLLSCALIFFCRGVLAADLNKMVLKEINKYPQKAGYDTTLKSGGVIDDIYFKDKKILSKGNGTYCSGFTFSVAFNVLKEKNLLSNMSVADMHKFQKQWYGVTKDAAERQCVDALMNFSMGISVTDLKSLKPGDFVQFWRLNKSGHSAILLETMPSDSGEIIGIKYISSQKSTDGIAVKAEYFDDYANDKGAVSKERFYAVRLSP